jgi:predicted nucleic acid-binding Zn ribbon protein
MQLAEHLADGGSLQSGSVKEGLAAVEKLKFRDKMGDWWAVGILSREWYRFIDGRWRSHDAPDGLLEGPAELERLAPPPGAPSRAAEDPPSSPSPARDAIEAITLVVRNTFGDYESGKLDSGFTTLLLRDHYLVDRSARLWSLGCRSRTWYVLDSGGWHQAPTPTLGSLPDATQFSAMRESGQVAELTLLALEADSLPEAVADPWNPPPGVPETPPPPTAYCKTCGAPNPVGRETCAHCGADPTKARPRRRTSRPRPSAAPTESSGPGEPRGRFCTACGAAVAPGMKFCTRCGTKAG